MQCMHEIMQSMGEVYGQIIRLKVKINYVLNFTNDVDKWRLFICADFCRMLASENDDDNDDDDDDDD